MSEIDGYDEDQAELVVTRVGGPQGDGDLEDAVDETNQDPAPQATGRGLMDQGQM